MKSLLIAFIFTFQSLASAGTFPCRDMSDERLLEILGDTESRLSCRASVGAGASCVGIAAGGALTASALLRKNQVKLAQSNLEAIKTLSQEIQGLTGAQSRIAASGDLSLAGNTGADAEIKKSIAEKTAELEKRLLDLKKVLVSNPEVVKSALEKIQQTRAGPEVIKELVRELDRLALVNQINKPQAKLYHQVAQELSKPIQALASGFSRTSSVAKDVASAGLKGSLSVGRKILGSRLFAFLGGVTFTGISLLAFTSNTGCGDRFASYITVDEDCKPLVEVTDNVLNFLQLPPAQQLIEMKNDSRVCDFYLTLSQKIRLEDRLAEVHVERIQNLSCGSPTSFEIASGGKISTFNLMLKDNRLQSFQEEGSTNSLRFNSEGTVNQYCSSKTDCDAVQEGASKKVLGKVFDNLGTMRMAIAEASRCCTGSDEDFNECSRRYRRRSGGGSGASSSYGSSSSSPSLGSGSSR